MEMVGAGIASLAFWGFMAAAVIVGVWDGAKKREAQHETLRRMIEGGKPLDEALMTKLMGGDPKRPDRDLAVGAIIVFAVAIGLAVLGVVLSEINEIALIALLGAAGLVACVGTGLWVASRYMRGVRAEDDAQARSRPRAS